MCVYACRGNLRLFFARKNLKILHRDGSLLKMGMYSVCTSVCMAIYISPCYSTLLTMHFDVFWKRFKVKRHPSIVPTHIGQSIALSGDMSFDRNKTLFEQE